MVKVFPRNSKDSALGVAIRPPSPHTGGMNKSETQAPVGRWEFDENGAPFFDCACDYCLGFINDVPSNHYNEME